MLVGSLHQEGGGQEELLQKQQAVIKQSVREKMLETAKGQAGTWKAPGKPVPSLQLCRGARHWIYLISPYPNCTA